MKKTEFFKINWSMLVLLAMAVSLLTISACNDDDDDPDPDPQPTLDIVETAQGETTLSTLVTALTEASLVATLQGEGPFTVFAPTNDAFDDLPTGVLEYLLANPTELASILQYHVVEGKVLSTDLATGPVTTLNGTIQVVVSGGDVTLNGVADVETADVEATNGVVHIIDEVLIPADFDIPVVLDIVETAQDTEILSTLVTAVTEAQLVATLQGEGPFTVFAPTNDAFAALPDGVLDYLLANPDELTNILKYHVVDGSILSDALTSGPVTTLNGTDIDIDVTSGVVINGSSEVVAADVKATNGVVHVIDEVLIPAGFIAENIVQVAVAADGLDSLVKALTLFPDLVETLSGTDNFTVFAPTNAAFEGLLEAIGQEQLIDIPESVVETVLKYHIVAGKIKSGDLTDGQTATTKAGEDITVDLDGGVFINTAEVTTADVGALNGVVHVIDEVLVNPSIVPIVGTIVAPAFFNKDFTTLIAAVQAASPSILETLLGNGPGDMGLTLFAPTNAAFEAAGITELPDAATLDAVLTYHVIDGTVFAQDLPPTGSAVTTLGGDFFLSINDNGVFINGMTEVVQTDITGSNGVVHVIDKTLLPASSNVVEIAVAASEATEGAEFTQLVAALTAVSQSVDGPDLITDLSSEDGSFTVFAPTDAAFQTVYDAIGDEDMDGDNDINDLVAAVGLPTIATVLQYHVLDMRVFSTDIPNALNGMDNVTLTPLAGGDFTLNSVLTITATDAVLSAGLDDAGIIDTDILGTNGVIHVIDQVLLP